MHTGIDPAARAAPLVSVVIPAYKAEGTLMEAVASCLAQTEPDLEILIVEDGSPDATLAVAQACHHLDPQRVRVLQHAGGANAGVAASRNLGIDSARGQYIAFLDSDDAWLPDKLRRQLDLMQREPSIGFVFGDVYLCVDPDPAQPMSVQALSLDPFRHGMESEFNSDDRAGCRALNLHPEAHRIVPSPTPLVRRELFEGGLRFAGPDRLRLQYEDYLMWKILAARTRVHYLPEPLAVYRVHDASFTGKFKASGSTLRHLQGLSDVYEQFVDCAASDVDVGFLHSMRALHAERIRANAHRIELSSLPGYLALAGKYGIGRRSLARVMAAQYRRGKAGAASLKRALHRLVAEKNGTNSQ